MERIHRSRRKTTTKQNPRREAFFTLGKLLKSKGVSLDLDGLLCASTNDFHINIFSLEKQIPNYDGEACMYKGKPNYSMKMAVLEEFGEEITNLILILL